MVRPLRIEFSGAHYHVTSRGNERKDVFKSQKDREQFLSYLESAVFRYGAVIHAYCLMSNHYHLLLETPSGNLSQIMKHINGAYTNYFNAKRKRYGHLFQGRYKAIVIDADEYAKELSRYIHLNPVRVGMVSRPEEYRWSSYLDYCGERKKPEWLSTAFILDYFGKGKAAGGNYRKFIGDLIGREYESPLNGATAATILGGAEFVTKITTRYVSGKQYDRDLPAARELSARPTLDAIIGMAETLAGNGRLSKKVSIYFGHKYSGA
jgi:putative transposase